MNIEEKNFSELWSSEPVIVLDSSSLLDLYRYAPRATNIILNNLEHIENNLWIPLQVEEEYKTNKQTVIKEAFKKYENVSTDINSAILNAEKTITSKFIRYGKFEYPEITELKREIDNLTSSLKEKAENFKSISTAEINKNKRELRQDSVSALVDRLKESGRIGKGFSFNEKLSIYKEGALRFKHLIPPGYKDEEKDKSDPTGLKKFGDLLIWKEILKKASRVAKPFIFITDDEKEDWWVLEKDTNHLGSKTIVSGPREELVSEFTERSSMRTPKFMMMTLKDLNKHLTRISGNDYKKIYLDELEFVAEEIANEIIEYEDWSYLVDGDGSLSGSLNFNNPLQDYVGELIQDVEVTEFSAPVFNEMYPDYEDENIVIEGSFDCVAYVIITVALGGDYTETRKAEILITGNITMDYKIKYDEENRTIERIDENVHTSNVAFNGIINVDKYEDRTNICKFCNKNEGIYMTNDGEDVCESCTSKFDLCTSCGTFFPLHSLSGTKCSNCED